MSIGARAFRDFLLRFAAEDGVLLDESRSTAKDLCRVIGADSSEAKSVDGWIGDLVSVGFLALGPNGGLTIPNFATAQTARSKGAERQAKYRDKRHGNATGDADGNVTGDGASNVTGASRETSQKEEKRREEKRDDADASRRDDIRDRCERLVRNPYDAQFSQPQTWPEIAEAAEILHQGLGYTSKPKLGSMGSDKGVSRIVEIFAAGFTLDELRTLQPKLKTHDFLRKAPRLHAVTVGILRELQESPVETSDGEVPWTN